MNSTHITHNFLLFSSVFRCFPTQFYVFMGIRHSAKIHKTKTYQQPKQNFIQISFFSE